MGGEEIGIAGGNQLRAREAQAGMPAAVGGAPAPLRPLRWEPGLPLPVAPQLSLSSPLSSPLPSLLLVDHRDPPVEAASAAMEAYLDADERARLDRFRRADDRHLYLVGRGVLRLALGTWLRRDPAALVFRYGPHGKPALDGVLDAAPHFNLAHSGDLILLAFHPSRPVGVDVELRRPGLDWRPIARRILPAAAVTRLETLPPEQGGAAFLDDWCRLEARLKASGEGLAGLERLRRESGPHPGGLALWDVEVPESYGAAVALAEPL